MNQVPIKRRRWKVVASFGLLLVMLAAGLLSCGRQDETQRKASDKSDQKPLIVASIFPLQDLVKQVVGDWAEVQVLMPPGSNPHHFEPTAQQVLTLSRAQVLVTVGLNLDPWAKKAMAKTRGQNRRVELEMAALTGISSPSKPHQHVHDHDHAHDAQGNCLSHGGVNPHLWLDLSATRLFVQALAKELVRLYPAHQEATERSAQALLEELDHLDQEYRQQLADVPVKSLVTFHNAFDVLAERYGLKVVAHLAEVETTPGGEVTPEHLMQAIKLIREQRLRTIYAEPQFPSRAVQMIQEQTGTNLLTLDPEGNPAIVGYGNYQEMMRSNLRTLVQGQSPAP